MHSALALTFTLFLLGIVLAQLNHALSGWGIYVWLGGLFVTHAALAPDTRGGRTAAFLGGLFLDCTAPVAFGTHALLFAAAYTFVFRLRDRVSRDENTARIVLALVTNLALFLVFSFLQSRQLPTSATFWSRVAVDLLCSQVVLVLITPWFCALQARTLDLADTFAAAYERRFN